MNKQKTVRVLNEIIASCKEITLAEESLRRIGIDISESFINSARDRLIECVCVMFEVVEHDMRGDEVVDIMLNTKLDEEEKLKRLIEIFGDEAIEK